VTAATGVQATTDAELVTIDKSKFTGASGLKYFLGTTDAAPAYNATGWSDNVPTAADITTPGPIYVWYYPVGVDSDDPTQTYSDGDMNATALQVTINPAPTYAVTFAEGTDANEWTASPNTGVSKGNTVTVTYTGSKKVIGVKAEKKAAAVSLIVNPVVGQIIGSDGINYDANATLPDGVTKVAMIAYVGNGSDCTNGLAIQLNSSPEMDWSEAGTYATGLTAVPGGTWRLPSKADWQNMFLGCAKSGDASSASDYMNPISGFKEKIAATGITWNSDRYWSSLDNGSYATQVEVFLYGSSAYASFAWDPKSNSHFVRACLAF
jgi:hypothetical protein